MAPAFSTSFRPVLPALLVFAFCMMMIASSRGMGETYGIFLLPLIDDFGWNRASVTSVYSVYMVSYGVGSLLSGLVYDRLGPRFNYIIGLLMLAGCYGFAGRLDSLYAFYIVVGICGGTGAAMVGIVPAQSLISRWFRRGRTTALSIAYSGQGIGVMLLAPAAQMAIEAVGWKDAYALASYGFVGAFALIMLMPWQRIAQGAGHGAQAERPATRAAPGVTANRRPVYNGPAGLTLRDAVFRLEFWGFFTIFGASAIAVFGVSLQAVAYLVDHGFSTVQAAFAFGFVGMLTIVGIALTGILAERFPRHIIATGSYGLTIVGISALAALQWHPSWTLLTVFVVCFGLSAGARGPIITAQMAELFAGRGLASIFGATNIGQGCGAALGAFLAGFLYDITGSYNTGFAVSLAFALVGLSVFWLVPAIRHAKAPADAAPYTSAE
jgi:MFS family permease